MTTRWLLFWVFSFCVLVIGMPLLLIHNSAREVQGRVSSNAHGKHHIRIPFLEWDISDLLSPHADAPETGDRDALPVVIDAARRAPLVHDAWVPLRPAAEPSTTYDEGSGATRSLVWRRPPKGVDVHNGDSIDVLTRNAALYAIHVKAVLDSTTGAVWMLDVDDTQASQLEPIMKYPPKGLSIKVHSND